MNEKHVGPHKSPNAARAAFGSDDAEAKSWAHSVDRCRAAGSSASATFGRGSGEPVRVLALTRYGRLGASSRLRTLQYRGSLALEGVELREESLFSSEALAHFYAESGWRKSVLLKAYARRVRILLARGVEFLWIEKELLPWLPFPLERLMLRGRRYALDIDDAVFHRYDQSSSRTVRRLLGRKLDGLFSGAALVVAGNDYLAERARSAGAPNVVVIPTVIDLDRYRITRPLGHSGLTRGLTNEPLTVGWVGSPTSSAQLEMLREPLRQLPRDVGISLRLVGASAGSLAEFEPELIPWTEESEASEIDSFDVGVMPLTDTPWRRGKCGYKLIQYMAMGKPVIASPVGVNQRIVTPEVGFLAGTPEEWVTAFTQLGRSVDVRAEMGAAARRTVEERYCLQVTAPELAEVIRAAARPKSNA